LKIWTLICSQAQRMTCHRYLHFIQPSDISIRDSYPT
jgi:hypothetical protein